ncbi:trehalose-phosphatase [Luteococcus peritonei]|uniref:Trehalose 6-phosphate phosphatase n=1 Tax=Luteococcus peritonei TaxID=88874 RepID=A0ABW4RVZ5_9ACTN
MSEQTATLPSTGQWRAVTELGERSVDLVAAHLDRTLLATDFDGTLSPIVEDPMAARMHPAARAALVQLAPRVGQLAVITGRGVDVVRELGRFSEEPAFGQVLVLGQYGQEAWDAASGETTSPPAPLSVRAAKSQVTELLAANAELDFLSGVAVEDKGRAIGVHTRRALDPAAAYDWLREPLAGIATEHELVLEPGRNVIELRSSTTTKGEALHLLAQRSHPAVVVMMGDDLGDLAAFAAVRELTADGVLGLCVVAGSQEQPAVAAQADVLCGGPEGVAAWLAEVSRAVDALPQRER